MPSRTLTTERLFLRPVAATDTESLWAIWRDPDVRRFLFDDIPVTRERAAEIVTDMMASRETGLGMWTLRLKNTSAIVGCAGLMKAGVVAEYAPSLAEAVEAIVALTPSAWHHGYAQEALRAVLEHGFAQLELPQLCAVADLPNEAAARLIERVGFMASGECAGPKHRLRTYALSREAWLENDSSDAAKLNAAARAAGSPTAR